jgi:hypothetical protein
MLFRLIFINSNKLAKFTRTTKCFLSSQPPNKNLPVVINKEQTNTNNESDPDLGLLIKKYLSKGLVNPTNTANPTDTVNIKIINFINNLEKLPNGQSLNLHLSGKEMENLIIYVKNNLNKELSYIVFISCKQLYSWLKTKE